MTRVSRRSFFRRAAAVGAVGAGLATQAFAQSMQPAPSRMPLAQFELAPLPFVHGVASGDPLPDAVVIWTRVTPDEYAWPGSGRGSPTPLRWEVAQDQEFTRIVREGHVVAQVGRDHGVHVDVDKLEPSSVYYYRFVVTAGPHEGATSPVGRTKTAPEGPVELQRWAVASCANYEAGFFAVYRDMAERAWDNELDLTVFLGDYIYEYAQGEYSGWGPVRLHEPAHETLTLADYRARYGHYRTDRDLQAAHAAMPWIVVWDDHEVANNFWAEGADNHQVDEGDFLERRDAAIRAYYEWMPVRTTEPSAEGHIYRSFRFGDLVELTVMDLRTYRDVEFWEGGRRQPGDARSMLGAEQYNWLIDTLHESDTTWNALGNSVMFSPMRLGAVMQSPKTRPVAAALSSNILTATAPAYEHLPLNGDQWDGFDFERRRVINTLGRLGKNPIFLTGDIHSEWAHTISYEGEQIGCEVVCASITAPNVAESLKVPGSSTLINAATRYIRAANPSLHHVAMATHGYCAVTITPDAVHTNWRRVDDILNPHSPVSPGTSLTWRRGSGFTPVPD